MDLKSKLEKLFEPALNDIGLLLIQICISGLSNVKLQITIERSDFEPMSMDDCVKASRELSALLDVEDPIEAAYTLEVSSPGDDRPLVKPQDFSRFVGHNIKAETYELIEGTKRFKGNLVSCDDTGFIIKNELNEAMTIRFDQVMKAKLNPSNTALKLKKRRS